MPMKIRPTLAQIASRLMKLRTDTTHVQLPSAATTSLSAGCHSSSCSMLDLNLAA